MAAQTVEPTYDNAAAEVELQRRADHARCCIGIIGPGRCQASRPPREEGRELVSAICAHARALHTITSLNVLAVLSGANGCRCLILRSSATGNSAYLPTQSYLRWRRAGKDNAQ